MGGGHLREREGGSRGVHGGGARGRGGEGEVEGRLVLRGRERGGVGGGEAEPGVGVHGGELLR